MFEVYLYTPLPFVKRGEHMPRVVHAKMLDGNSCLWLAKVKDETSFVFCSQSYGFFFENDEPWKQVIYIPSCAPPDGTDFCIHLYPFL